MDTSPSAFAPPRAGPDLRRRALMTRCDRLRPRSLAVLRVLCDRSGEVVSRRELLDAAWGGRVVTDDSLTQCIADIRRRLRDVSGVELVTFARRGYRLDLAEPLRMPSVAVLPFARPAGLDGDTFAFALVEEIVTELARHKDLFVVATRSTRLRQDRLAPATRTADELGVRYLLTGSVARDHDALRVNASFVDAASDRLVWSERFELTEGRAFASLPTLAGAIVNRVGGSAGVMLAAERDRVSRAVSAGPDAWDHYVRGSDVATYFSAEGSLRAIAHLRDAVAADPRFVRAWARLAAAYLCQLAYTYTDDPEATAALYVEAACTAAELDPFDAFANALAGGARHLVGEPERGAAHFERALALGPNDADTLAAVAYIRPTKQPTAAEDLANLRRALAMNPCHPAWYSLAFGYCGYHAGAFAEAVGQLLTVPDDFLDKHLYLCLCYAELGDAEGVERHRPLLLSLKPAFSTATVVAADAMVPEAASKVLTSARAAGLPD